MGVVDYTGMKVSAARSSGITLNLLQRYFTATFGIGSIFVLVRRRVINKTCLRFNELSTV